MDMSNLTLITLAWELYQQGIPKSRIATQLKKNRETIHLWLKGIEKEGLLPFLEHYQRAKKGPRSARQVDPLVKRLVWELREREADCCGQKIAYFLVREHGMHLSVPKSYEILREKYVLRSKWRKNQVRGPVPQATAPRQVVQMDTVLFGGIYAFTGIDIYTKEAALTQSEHHIAPNTFIVLLFTSPILRRDLQTYQLYVFQISKMISFGYS